MGNGLLLGASGGAGALRALDVAANNLANSQTTGFKADRVVFSVTSAETVDLTAGGRSRLLDTVSSQVDFGVTDFSSGGSIPTDEPTDLAVEGDGFFHVRDEAGREYLTRDGAFRLDAEGNLATRGGLLVLTTEGEPVQVAGGSFTVEPDGAVLVDGVSRGRLAIKDVEDRAGLTKVGGTRFEFSGTLVDGQGEVAQGRLEGSNVESVDALVELIALQRYYEAFQKTAQAGDEMDQQLAQRVGRKSD